MRTLIAAAIALSLAGCASSPRPQMMVAPHYTKSSKAVQPMPQAMPVTPNSIVKKRWYDRFKKHPVKWFH